MQAVSGPSTRRRQRMTSPGQHIHRGGVSAPSSRSWRPSAPSSRRRWRRNHRRASPAAIPTGIPTTVADEIAVGGADHGHLVLWRQAHHPRHPRRLWRQRLVGGVVRCGPLRGRQVPQRHGHRLGSGWRPPEGHLGRQLLGRPGRQRHSIIIPDAGAPGAQLQSLQDATKAGVTVVPWGSDPAGVAGTDYADLCRLGHHR